MTKKSKTILLVEDDSFKLDRIAACLSRAPFDLTIVCAGSVQAAVEKIGSGRYDFIFLDMSLPSHDLKPGGGAGASLLSGGIEIIMELSFLKRTDAVVIVTQYPEVEIEGELIPISRVHSVLCETFESNTIGVILYRHESTLWEDEVLSIMELRE